MDAIQEEQPTRRAPPKGMPKLPPRSTRPSQQALPSPMRLRVERDPSYQRKPKKEQQAEENPMEGKPKEEAKEKPKEETKEKPKEKPKEEPEEERSLTTILNPKQRTDLTILLAAATATMRDSLTSTFDASATLPSNFRKEANASEDDKIMNPSVDPGTADVAAHDRERKMLAAREKELSETKMKELRDAAVDWFDHWRESVIKRVGEVVNSKKEAKSQIEAKEVKKLKPKVHAKENTKIDPADGKEEDEQTKAEKILRDLYPPVKTPLANLEEEKRVFILHSLLLLLLSLENYASPSRVLLLHVTSSLKLPLSMLNEDERKTAQGLLQAAKELTGATEAQKKADENQSARKWKVGLASVAGAAVIGITGGMAAPLVAAGVGSVMGGLGLGATAAAGYLGSVAGSTMVVGGLFGAYGGRMTGQMMDNYAREVSDFAFIPVHGKKHHLPLLASKDGKGEEKAGKKDPQNRRLRVTIGITGWLTEKEEVVKPWRVIGDDSEVFALRWELESLMHLGNAMTEMLSSAAWGYAKKQLISQTVFAEMMAAMWPVALLQVSRVVDNPFSVAKSRAEKAGAVLADAIINRAQGERPVTLIGYSLGARVIYACLLSLAARRAFGLIDSVVLIGAPLPSESRDWRAMRSVVASRLVNVYSENDRVLGFLYRTSSVQLGVAGLQPVKGVQGVENVDVSDTVSGHLRYRYLVGSILKKIGFEDLDFAEVEKEEEALKKMDEEERQRIETAKQYVPGTGKKAEQGPSEADAQKEAEGMEKKVHEKTESSLAQRGAELIGLGGSGGGSGGGNASAKGDRQSSGSYLGAMAPKWPFGGAADATPKSTAAATAQSEMTDGGAGKPADGKNGADEKKKEAATATPDRPQSYLEMASSTIMGSASSKPKPPKLQTRNSGKKATPDGKKKETPAKEEDKSPPASEEKKKKKTYMQMASDQLPSFSSKKTTPASPSTPTRWRN